MGATFDDENTTQSKIESQPLIAEHGTLLHANIKTHRIAVSKYREIAREIRNRNPSETTHKFFAFNTGIADATGKLYSDKTILKHRSEGKERAKKMMEGAKEGAMVGALTGNPVRVVVGACVGIAKEVIKEQMREPKSATDACIVGVTTGVLDGIVTGNVIDAVIGGVEGCVKEISDDWIVL